MNFFKKLAQKIKSIFTPKKKQQKTTGGGQKPTPVVVSPIQSQPKQSINLGKSYTIKEKPHKESKVVATSKEPKNRKQYTAYAMYLNKKFKQDYESKMILFKAGDIATMPEYKPITGRDVKEYIKEYQRSRNKYYRDLKRQKEKGDVLLPLKFSGNLKNLTSSEQFNERLENMKKYNAKGSTIQFNSWVRDNCRENIYLAFGKYGRELNNLIDSMTDSQYYIFFKENKELEALAYGSPKSVQEYINMTLLNYNNILSRVTKFLGE